MSIRRVVLIAGDDGLVSHELAQEHIVLRVDADMTDYLVGEGSSWTAGISENDDVDLSLDLIGDNWSFDNTSGDNHLLTVFPRLTDYVEGKDGPITTNGPLFGVITGPLPGSVITFTFWLQD